MTTLDARLRELLAVKLDEANFHHSAARLRGEKNTGHLMTAEMMEAAIAFGVDVYKLGLSDAAEIADMQVSCGCGRDDCYTDNIPRAIANSIRAKGELT